MRVLLGRWRQPRRRPRARARRPPRRGAGRKAPGRRSRAPARRRDDVRRHGARRHQHEGSALMAMGRMGHGAPSMRTFMKDRSVTQHKLPEGIVKRIAQFAAPVPQRPRRLPRGDRRRLAHRRADPAALRADHRQRDREARQRRHHRPRRRSSRRSPSPARVLSLWQRCISARIGEGLIYDMRDEGLRPRPADAARVLHPHPDRRARLAAQQRRARRAAGLHRHAVVGRQQPRHRRPRRWRRCSSCPGRSRSSSLVLLPVFVFPPGCIGRRLAGDHARVLRPERRDERR